MSSRHLVDPELLPLLDLFPMAALRAENLEERREAAHLLPAPDAVGTTVEVLSIPGPDGAPPVGLRLYRPDRPRRPQPCILHIHGGGYVLGSAREFEALVRPLAATLDCTIVSIEYRLAPETVFPGAVEDCYAALAWVVANAAVLGVDSRTIGVMGESAGGGLAAALALLARDRGEYRIAFQHLIYPMLDDRTCVRPDQSPLAGEFVWHPANNHFGWSAMLGCKPGGNDVSPYAAPARAENLAGLPPTFIAVGALDLFLEEDLDYACRLLRAGVPTELHLYPGAFHAFDLMPGPSIADMARRDSHAALGRFMAG